MNKVESRKPVIAEQMAEAGKAGDFDLIDPLCNDLNRLVQ